MENLSQVFKDKDFGPLRAIDRNGEFWFVAEDVAEILKYRDAYNMTRRLNKDEKGTHLMSTPGGPQEMTIINESGLYHAIMGSKKPSAVRFRKWVTGEVIPSLRKHEQYTIGQETLDDEELLAKALQRRG